MKREFLDYVEDIVEAMDDVMSFVERMDYDGFVKNKMASYAVIRVLEIVEGSGKGFRKVREIVIQRYLGRKWLK